VKSGAQPRLGVRANDDPDASRDAGQLLDGDRVGQRIETRAADLLGVWHAQQPQAGRLADDLGGELAATLHLVGYGCDLALGEVADGAPDLDVRRGEGKVHRFASLAARLVDTTARRGPILRSGPRGPPFPIRFPHSHEGPRLPSSVDVRLDHITKRFHEVVAVDDLSLEIVRGEFFSMLGPSGCGKTTTLRMIGGFEEATSGTIYLGETDVTGLPPFKRDVNTVFQNYALFPHLTVFENVAFGLRRRKVAAGEIATQVTQMLELVELPGYEARKPSQLSGGPAAAGRPGPRADQPSARAPPRRAARTRST